MKIYDLIIIGAGPAGITASVYAAYPVRSVITASGEGAKAALSAFHYLSQKKF